MGAALYHDDDAEVLQKYYPSASINGLATSAESTLKLENMWDTFFPFWGAKQINANHTLF